MDLIFTLIVAFASAWFGSFLQNESTKSQNNTNRKIGSAERNVREIQENLHAFLYEQDDEIRAIWKMFRVAEARDERTIERLGTTYIRSLGSVLNDFPRSQSRVRSWFGYDARKLLRRLGEKETRLEDIGERFDLFYEDFYNIIMTVNSFEEAQLADESNEATTLAKDFYDSMALLTERQRRFAAEVRALADSLDELIPPEVTVRSKVEGSLKGFSRRLSEGQTPFNAVDRGGVLVRAARRLEYLLGRDPEDA